MPPKQPESPRSSSQEPAAKEVQRQHSALAQPPGKGTSLFPPTVCLAAQRRMRPHQEVNQHGRGHAVAPRQSLAWYLGPGALRRLPQHSSLKRMLTFLRATATILSPCLCRGPCRACLLSPGEGSRQLRALQLVTEKEKGWWGVKIKIH